MSVIARSRTASQAPAGCGTQIWFQDLPTTPLEIARAGIGGALLLHYAWATPFLLTLWGDHGVLPRETDSGRPWRSVEAIGFLLFRRAVGVDGVPRRVSPLLRGADAGWRTSWVKWIVLIGNLSYANRTPFLAYGVDSIWRTF